MSKEENIKKHINMYYDFDKEKKSYQKFKNAKEIGIMINLKCFA